MKFFQSMDPSKRIFFCFGILVAFFLVLRLSGLFLPYHQDEWKNVQASETVLDAGSFFAHPPLVQMIFTSAFSIFGEDFFRFLPILFSLASLVLFYFVVRNRLGEKTALWSSFFFVVCFYNLLGSLMVDVDGAILPFFFLLSLFCYDKFLSRREEKKWFVFLSISLLLGFLIKLSFMLVVATFFLDYAWQKRGEASVKKISVLLGIGACFSALYVLLLYGIQFFYPAFSIHFMLSHAHQFSDGSGRNYIQIVVQGIKAFYLVSPLLLVPLLFLTREVFRKTRIFFIYLGLGCLFYFVLFDFSKGALDKYLMFYILPLSIIVAVIFSKIFGENGEGNYFAQKVKWGTFVGIGLSFLLFVLNFLSPAVIALYPKEEWFGRVVHLKWNMLTPFTGGSGPLGFSVSFLFIIASFFVCFFLVIVGLVKKEWKVPAFVAILCVGLLYNGVFSEELLFGKINGNSGVVLREVVQFLRETPAIEPVLTYNDIGAHELSDISKYAGRFYATPQYEEGHRKKFADFRYYVVVDIPHLYEQGFYGKFFSRCTVLFETTSSTITGRVYDCHIALRSLNTL